MKNFFIIGSIILILLFSAVYFAKPNVKGMKIILTAISRPENTDALREQIKEREAKYNADCQKLLYAFRADLEKKVEPDFASARRSVPKLVNDLCGFKVCVKLCYKAAKDKMEGTHDLLDAYSAAMNAPIIQPCRHANMIASNMLQNLQLCLKERYLQYVSDLATVCNNDNSEWKLPPKDLENLQNCLDSFAGTVRQAHLKKLMAGIGTSYEVIYIRKTCRGIVKLFAKPVAKICGSLGAAGICAAADGPLPFGDMVGVAMSIGGLAWTAWDIYDVTCVMPQKLNVELRNGIASTKAKLLEESSDQAKKIVQIYQQSGRGINQKLMAQLK